MNFTCVQSVGPVLFPWVLYGSLGRIGSFLVCRFQRLFVGQVCPHSWREETQAEANGQRNWDNRIGRNLEAGVCFRALAS
jgi:hypothetical protein